MILLIDWADALVGHHFEIALTVISNAPKYCISDFPKFHSFSKGHKFLTALTTFTRAFHSVSVLLLSFFLQQLRMCGGAIVNLVFTSLKFLKKTKKCGFSIE